MGAVLDVEVGRKGDLDEEGGRGLVVEEGGHGGPTVGPRDVDLLQPQLNEIDLRPAGVPIAVLQTVSTVRQSISCPVARGDRSHGRGAVGRCCSR
jgi:hypothetical protein